MVTYSFPPRGGGGVLRQLKFAKYLPDFDWQPYILTVNEKHNFEDFQLLKELPDCCQIFRTGKITENKMKIYKKDKILFLFKMISEFIIVPDRFIFWLYKAVPLGLKIIRKNNIDLIYSIDYPNTNHIAAIILHWITKKPWVADFKDIWTVDYAYRKIPPFSWIDRFLQKMVLTTATALICVNEAMRNRFMRCIGNRKNAPIKVIPNGFDEDDFHPFQEPGYTAKSFTIAYSGTIYQDLLPFLFLKTIKILLAEKQILADEIRIIYIGQLEREEDINSEIFKELQQIGILEYKQQLSHEKTLQIIRRADVLLLSLSDIIDSDFIIPSKAFEYMASGKIIFTLTNPENSLAKFILSANAGVVVDYKDLTAVKGAIINLIRLSRSNEFRINKQTHYEIIKRYTRRNLTLELAKTFDETTVN